MGTVPASHLAGITLGRNHIGLLAGRPEILRFTTRCRQLCDDYIPWLRFKGNYFISSFNADILRPVPLAPEGAQDFSFGGQAGERPCRSWTLPTLDTWRRSWWSAWPHYTLDLSPSVYSCRSRSFILSPSYTGLLTVNKWLAGEAEEAVMAINERQVAGTQEAAEAVEAVVTRTLAGGLGVDCPRHSSKLRRAWHATFAYWGFLEIEFFHQSNQNHI